MTDAALSWTYKGQVLTVGLSRCGTGPTILLLPAPSSISTRGEMLALQQHLAKSYTAISIDWPGFGELPRPYLDWRPEVYEQFLAYLLTHLEPFPFAVIAAGHAAGYLLKHCARHHPRLQRLVLLSPTWRGPLPTMMNGKYKQFPRLAKAVDLPLVGPLLYKLNVNRIVVGMMARGHVYADPDWLNEERLQQKLLVTRAPGARHSSVRFVAGCIDPFPSRDEFLAAAKDVDVPILNLFSERAPRKSRFEMEALAALANVTTRRLPQGKLSIYEEFPDAAATPIVEFLTTPV